MPFCAAQYFASGPSLMRPLCPGRSMMKYLSSTIVVDLAARFHAVHLLQLSRVLLWRDTAELCGLKLLRGQSHRTACWPSGRQRRNISRWGGTHGNRSPLLSYWGFTARLWLGLRPAFNRPRLLSVAIAARRDAKMALDGGDEIGIVPRLAVAHTLH